MKYPLVAALIILFGTSIYLAKTVHGLQRVNEALLRECAMQNASIMDVNKKLNLYAFRELVNIADKTKAGNFDIDECGNKIIGLSDMMIDDKAHNEICRQILMEILNNVKGTNSHRLGSIIIHNVWFFREDSQIKGEYDLNTAQQTDTPEPASPTR